MKYRRIEVNAFRRKVTIVSGEWRPDDLFDVQHARTDEDVSLDDTDSCEPVTTDSLEGQLILVEAARSLERRLTPENRAAMYAFPGATLPASTRHRLGVRLQSVYQLICSKAPRFARREK